MDAKGKVVTRKKFGPAESLLAALGDPRIAEIDESAELLENLPDDQMKALLDKHGAKIRGLSGQQIAQSPAGGGEGPGEIARSQGHRSAAFRPDRSSAVCGGGRQ